MMRNSKHLHLVADIAVDNGKRKATQSNLTEVWLSSKLELMWRRDSQADGMHYGRVILPAKSNATDFVIADLLFVLQCRFWMKAVGHLKRACTLRSSSSDVTS